MKKLIKSIWLVLGFTLVAMRERILDLFEDDMKLITREGYKEILKQKPAKGGQ